MQTGSMEWMNDMDLHRDFSGKYSMILIRLLARTTGLSIIRQSFSILKRRASSEVV